jgi:GT2 family glycosyltransferase/glycosyltransferase involved in cell wall biosynthesis
VNEEIVFPVEDDPVASIIVLAWRAGPFLLDCLRSVEEHVRAVPYEVIIVLNEPTNELFADVQRAVTGAMVLRTRVNVGYGGAHNLAARYARGEYLVLLNDDAVVHSNWLETLVETVERRSDAGAIGSTTLFPDGTLQEAGCVIWDDGSTVKVGRNLPSGTRKFDYERRVDFCSGASLLVRRKSWFAVGGMDDAYYPAYYEDTDLCLKLAELGETTWYQPRSYISHQESASTNSEFRAFLFAKNKAIFRERWERLLGERETAEPWDPQAIDRAAWSAMGRPPRVLMIDDQVADPRIGSGYPRASEVYSTLQEVCGYQLSIFSSLIDGAVHNDAMCRLGVAVVDESLGEHLEGVFEPYDAVVISRPHNYERFAPTIRQISPLTPIIYDAEALFHRRMERQSALATTDADRDRLAAEAAAMRELEREIAEDANALVTISEEEAAFCRQFARGLVSINGPLLLNIDPSPAGFFERSDIGFVAGWAGGGTSPNVDAVHWFVREVMPSVQARVPGARLLVTGINPPPEALRLESSAVVFVGSVDRLSEFYDSIRVVIVPMRFGAGVKNKTIEALQYGVPTVATDVGAEGVPADSKLGALLVSDNAEDFAARVAALVDDRDAWDLQRRRVLLQLDEWRAAESNAVWETIVGSVMNGSRLSGEVFG